MSHRTSTRRRSWKERALSLLLTAALMAGLIPGLTLPASAEHWADAYLDQLVDWGVMRADQTSNPDADLTRAEFFAIINRAYGYTEPGYMPFEDVLETDWFYDDISIAYNAGYMAGTSATTASPNDPLTREQAFCILGRNMMLAEVPGENLTFADSREISDWARGTIKAAADRYIVTGFPDNTLHPLDSISKGQMAVLISQCLGTPIRESGVYDLGGVFGNVTITAPNVTLRNATISGDLYISGGVGLGGIKLENVDVLGKIIVSSTGESEDGSASVIMRNVTAEELLVDNMRSKTVTLRADGITYIASTVVRTNAYLEDNNTDDKGLMHIEVDGDPGLRLTLAGRIKEVVNKTPASFIQAAQGTVAKLTVDEAATNSSVQIDRNTKIAEVNLDVATNVFGDGDIDKLNVNAPGSTVTMLPDDIYVRPGLTASIAGVIMDHQAAQEGSLDPRLLAGYPAAKDIAPTGFRADFAGNKKGTIYWGVSYVSDGSIGEDDLISPPSYGNKAIANGSVAEPAGGEEVSAQVGNLVVGGSYYLSAVLVDEMKERSPVKVVSFSTPDNTVPAFAQGYPQMSRVSANVGGSVVTVMPTKSCKLYYALLPQGAKAPTANELKAAAVTGNLGYGVRDVIKNTEAVFPVNSQQLEELKTYVLYLWLTDADGATSSNVVSLSFTTPDVTPPKFNPEPTPSGNPGATNVPLIVGLTEPGTVYWVAVPRGVAYPLPHNGVSDDNVQDAAGILTGNPTTDWAKSQVKSGRLPPEGGRAGSVRIANANTDVAMNITGLERETAYDLYYVAVDNATPVGNYSERVQKLSINTLDMTSPTVRQRFTVTAGLDDISDPLVSTDIQLIFSEDVISYLGFASGQSLLDIWAKVGVPATENEGRNELHDLLSHHIVLKEYGARDYEPVTVLPPGAPRPANSSWIDFSKATVLTDKGEVIVTLPYSTTPSESAHRLISGTSYYFEIENLADNSHNRMDLTKLPVFTTVFAQVSLRTGVIINAANGRPIVRDLTGDPNASRMVNSEIPAGEEAEVDYTFQMLPRSTSTVDVSHSYDLQLYTGTSMAFDLYCRITDSNGQPVRSIARAKELGILAKSNPITGAAPLTEADANNWFYLGNSGNIGNASGQILNGVSVNGQDTMGNQAWEGRAFPLVQTLNESCTYDFVISLTRLGSTTERAVWSASNVEIHAYVMAGHNEGLVSLTRIPDMNSEDRDAAMEPPLSNDGLRSIGTTEALTSYLVMRQSFADTRVPNFNRTYPQITAGDSFASVKVQLDRPGTIYYAYAPLGEIGTTATGHPNWTSDDLWNHLPQGGQTWQSPDGLQWVYTDNDYTPNGATITDPNFNPLVNTLEFNPPTVYEIQDDEVEENVPGNRERTLPLTNLLASEKYILYFVLRGDGRDTSQVYAYAFETTESSAPKIQLTDGSGSVEMDTSYGYVPSTLDWVLFTTPEGDPMVYERVGPIKVPSEMTGYYDKYGDEIDPVVALMEDYVASLAYGDDYDEDNTPDQYNSDHNYSSIFDVLATDEQKEQLYNIIQNPGSDLVVSQKKGDTTPDSGGSYKTNAEWLKLSTRYSQTPPNSSARFLILVRGRNTASQPPENYTTDPAAMRRWILLHSFRANDDIKIRDPLAPKLQGNNGSVYGPELGVPSGSVEYDPYTNTYSGNFQLVFDKDLYWIEEGTTTPIYKVNGGSDRPVWSGIRGEFGNVGLMYNALANSFVASSSYIGATRINAYSYNIEFHDVKNSNEKSTNVFISLLSDGLLSNASGITTNATITLSFDWKTIPGTKTKQAQLYISFADNDGTVSQYALIEGNTETESETPTPKIPELKGISVKSNPSVDSVYYTFEVTITFDNPLYYKNSPSDDEWPGVSSSVLAKNFSFTAASSSTSGTTPTVTPGSGSAGSDSYTLTVGDMSEGTIKFLGGKTFCDSTGQKTTQLDFSLQLTQEDEGTLLSPKVTYVKVSFDGVTTDPHKVG